VLIMALGFRGKKEPPEAPPVATEAADPQGKPLAPPTSRLRADAPIRKAAEDRLGRKRLAQLIAEEVATAPVESGFVTALTGPWGDGKTSVLNLVEERLNKQAECVVVKFNPWLFADTEALVVRFFAELGAELKVRAGLSPLATQLMSYGQALLPLTSLLGPYGVPIAAVLKGGKNLAELAPSDLKDKKAKVEEELRKAKRRIVVIVDDLDRLQHQEIRDVIRLVKLVGDLPYVTYVLAFERTRVERALGDDRAPDHEADGRDYLEKVVQLIHELPVIPSQTLQQLLVEDLNNAIEDLPARDLDEQRWHQLLGLGIRLFINNLRDVRRYVNSVPAMLRILGREIALEDLLALEALRLFEPRVHAAIGESVAFFTGGGAGTTRSIFGPSEDAKAADQERADRILGLATRSKEATQDLLSLLFPATADFFGGPKISDREAQKRREVSDETVLRGYLHTVLQEDAVSVETIDDVLGHLGDEDYLRVTLESLSGAQLLDLVDRLANHGEDFKAEDVEVAAKVFLAQQPRLQDRATGIFTLPGRWSLHRLIHFLVAAVPAAAQANLIERLYEEAATNSQRWWLLSWFGTYPQREKRNQEEELLNESKTEELGRDLRERIRQQSPAGLAAEEDLFMLLYAARDSDEAAAEQLLSDDSLMLEALRRSVQPVQTMGIEGYVISEETRFNQENFDRLVSRDYLVQRVEALLAATPTDSPDRSVLEVASDWLKRSNE
jgi:KAP family P-loop domain